MSPTPLPWLPGWLPVYGRFASVSSPWTRLGCNAVPIVPGDKNPAVKGWGKPDPTKPCLHSVDSPKCSPETLARWAHDFRDLSVAIFPASIDATVVDVDAMDRLDAVLAVCGPTPFRTYSGREGGGVHLWYHGASRSKNAITTGVDVKSTGGYVIAPGSIHAKTGNEYTASPELVDALARGVLTLPRPREGWRQALEALGSGVTTPTRFDLRELSDRLRSRESMREVSKAIRAVAEGKSFAEPGERDSALYRVVCALAEEWPAADVEQVAQLFAASAVVMEGTAPVGIPIVDAVRQKWDRVVRDRAERAEVADEYTTARRRLAWRWVGIDSDHALEVEQPLVVHHGKGYFLRVGETFAGPWTRDELTPDVLASMSALYGVQLEDGADLLARFGARAAELRQSLGANTTTYEPATSVMTVACAPVRRDLTPMRAPAVESIIAEIGGPYARELTLWLAGLLRSDVPCRALVLSGKRGRGKSLLLDGVARLWPHGAAKMRDVLGRRFNSELASAGLAIADDDTSPAEGGQALATFLREAVHDRVQRLERKFQDVGKVEGCMRYALATNDPFDLVQGAVSYSLNTESLEAFGDRLLHVPVPDSAAGCWTRAGVTGDELVGGDMIARHVLWLSSLAVGVAPEDRFWVGPGDESLARLAVLSSGLRGEVLIQIASALASAPTYTGPTQLEGTGPLGVWVAVDADRVIIRPAGLFESWHDAPRNATKRSVGLAIAALAGASSCAQPGRNGVFAVDRSLVAWYADKCGV